jgi:hypothetical protein
MPAFAEPEKPSLTTVPDFSAVENVGAIRDAVAVGGS